MPIYTYVCRNCGNNMDVYKEVERRFDPVTCECGASAEKALTAPRVWAPTRNSQ